MIHDRKPVSPERAQTRSADEILQGLDPVAGKALRLIYFSGLTQAQAASALGVTRAVISTCVAQGMSELADRLLRTVLAVPSPAVPSPATD